MQLATHTRQHGQPLPTMTTQGWIVRPKTEAPECPAFAVSRLPLNRLLSRGLDKPVTVVGAPLGFGKTVLLSQWFAERRAHKLPTGWLRVDTNDDTPGVLASYIAVVLCRIGFEHAGLDALTRGTPASENADLQLISAVTSDDCQRPNGAVLILDSVERISNTTYRSLLQPLLEYLPADLHVVLSTRQPQRLPVSDLLLREQISTIGPQQLRLTESHCKSLVATTFNKSQRVRLQQRTLGWPAAMALFRAHAATCENTTLALATFGGNSRVVVDYLSAQFAESISSELFTVLRDASLLDALNPSAVEYVTERDDVRQDLALLNEIDGLFVETRDENKPSLHPLLAEFLSSDLERFDALRYRQLCRRTARWIADNGSVIEAMRRAARIADTELAAEILEDAGGLMLWDRDGIGPLRLALELLPDAVIRRRPRIALIQATVCLKDGQLTEARRILNAVQETRSDDKQLQHEIAKVALSISFYQGTAPQDHLAALERAPQFPNGINPQVFYFTGKCLASLQTGDFQGARLAAQRGLSFDFPFSSAYFHLHLGVIAVREGRLHDAYVEYQQARQIARQKFADDKDMRLVTDVLMAEVSYERNELDSAARYLGNASKRLRHGEAWFEIYAAGYTTALNLAFANGGLNAVYAESTAALAYIREQELRRLRRLVVANTSALITRAGDRVAARQLVQENGLSLGEYIGNNANQHVAVGERMDVGIALCRLLIAEKRYRHASESIEQLLNIERRIGHQRAVVKLSLLSATAHLHRRRRRTAFNVLTDVLRHARTESLMRSVLDESPFVDELLIAYCKAGRAPEHDHARFLLGLITHDSGDTTRLSNREREVLQLLGDALPDKLIARRLGISENTVRFHLKNLFRKLGVSSRLQAVAEARNRVLIDDRSAESVPFR
ncbi:MAG: LuxR C-terminal-related transcriptional regulator [Pseudomonadota bacterium]